MSAGPITLDIKFVNPIQEEFNYCNKRTQNFNGSFGNGKTYGAMQKSIELAATFPYYRTGISRYSSKELAQSTMSTFFKICPPTLYNEAYGGRRNDREGYLRLINGSEYIWMHLDDYSEGDLRGKEFNSVITDQMEEISEEIYNTLDARMERWEKAEIPKHLNPELFPKNKFTGKPMPPCYNMGLFNPDTTLHWIYRRFHPESATVSEYQGELESSKFIDEYTGSWYWKDAAWFSASMKDNPAIPDTLKAAYLKRDPSWIARFYLGKWGIAGGAIHHIDPQSILDWSKRENRPIFLKLLDVIKRDGIKYRVMDHGENAPTCCLWFAWLSSSVLFRNYGIKSKGIHICYKEYYQPGKLIKYHREMIAHLSGDEKYYDNFADPAIFKKNQQKYGGFWTTAADYLDTNRADYTPEELKKAPPILWNPADNNEMSCRDAVHQLLALDENIINPFLDEPASEGSPAIYFLKQHAVEYPHGALNVISQTASARRKKVGNINGEDIYSDERAETTDHAYDPLRYYAIMPKSYDLPEIPREHPQFSFNRHLSKHQFKRRGSSYGRR